MRTYRDAEGHPAAAEQVTVSSPCILCRLRCTIRFNGDYVHLWCWEDSTAEQRRAAVAGQTQTAAPEVTEANDTAPGDNAAGEATTPETSVTPAVVPGVTPNPNGQTAKAPGTTATTPARSARPDLPEPGSANAGFPGPAAILDIDAIYIASERLNFPTVPLRHIGDVAALVYELGLGTQVSSRREEPGQIWLTGDFLRDHASLDMTEVSALRRNREEAVRNLTRTADFVTAALNDGWEFGGEAGDSLGTWTRVWRGERRGVWVVLMPALRRSEKELEARMPMIAGEPSPAIVARRLAAFTGATQMPWVINAATTGIDLMRHCRPNDSTEVFAALEPVPPAALSTVEGDHDWYRQPTTEELANHRFMHGYDRGGSYLAGVAGLELGIGEPEHHPIGRSFDKKLPGYHRIEVPDPADWRFPHPLNPHGSMPAGPVWVTTPTLQLAYELGYEVEVLEAYVWPKHGRILDDWYGRLRDARASLDVDDEDLQRARDMVKAVYAESIGMIASKTHRVGKPGYAPERRDHILAKARANILRKILKIGRAANPANESTSRWPIAATRDTIFYTSDDPNPETAWPGEPKEYGRGLGQYTAEVSGLLADQLPYLTGPIYLGKPALTDADEWVPEDHADAPYIEAGQ